MFILCVPVSVASLPQTVLKKRDQVQAEYEGKLEAVAFRKEERTAVSLQIQ